MDEQQALAEAQRLWGPHAYVLDRLSLRRNGESQARDYGRFYVGCPSLGGNFPYGNGDTWEKAFKNVERA